MAAFELLKLRNFRKFYLEQTVGTHKYSLEGKGLKSVEKLEYAHCKGKVKQSRNRPGVAQRIPGGLSSQIS
jgi:hypothetical protein